MDHCQGAALAVVSNVIKEIASSNVGGFQLINVDSPAVTIRGIAVETGVINVQMAVYDSPDFAEPAR